MRYLFGDSTESDLDFNYLAFLREVMDCAVVMLEAEQTLAANVERRRAREQETAGMIRAVEELGKDAAGVVDAVVKEQPKTPVGRCAATIADAIRDAVGRESAQAASELANSREEIDREDTVVRTRARGVLEKLLRVHDLPGADKELEVVWTGGGAKATMRQRTSFGLEAAVSLDIAANPLFGPDLRVERIDDRVEVHAHEAGGWLKKADKLVTHKLGRYQIVGISAGADTTIRLRATPDSNGTGLTITVKANGNIAIEGSGNNAGKGFEIEERDRARLQQLADKLAGAVRGLDQRTGLVSAELDGTALAEHPHPRVIAERLITAIAPTVQKIVKHGRNPGELVLRRQLADDRREEIFVPVSELVRKLDGLPPHARAAFVPLQLGIDPNAPTARVPEAKPRDTRSPDVRSPDARPSEPKAKPFDFKPSDPHPGDARPLDVKAPEVKAADVRIPELKSADGTVPDAKPFASSYSDPDTKPTRSTTPTGGSEPVKLSAPLASALAPGPAPREKPKSVPPPMLTRTDSSQPILLVKTIGASATQPGKGGDDKDDPSASK